MWGEGQVDSGRPGVVRGLPACLGGWCSDKPRGVCVTVRWTWAGQPRFGFLTTEPPVPFLAYRTFFGGFSQSHTHIHTSGGSRHIGRAASPGPYMYAWLARGFTPRPPACTREHFRMPACLPAMQICTYICNVRINQSNVAMGPFDALDEHTLLSLVLVLRGSMDCGAGAQTHMTCNAAKLLIV